MTGFEAHRRRWTSLGTDRQACGNNLISSINQNGVFKGQQCVKPVIEVLRQ